MKDERLVDKELSVDALRTTCKEEEFSFETTGEFTEIHEEIIGQQRAVSAMDFGLEVRQEGYNLFVVGPAGTGRTTFTMNKINQLAKSEAVPNDWCYVYNFENPDRPVAIPLQAGKGHIFQHDMQTLLRDIETEIRRVFSGDEYERKRREMLRQYEEESEELWTKLEEFAKDQHFMIERTPAGINSYPVQLRGRPFSKQEFQALPDKMKESIKQRGRIVEQEIEKTIREIQKIERIAKKAFDQFQEETVQYTIHHLFEPLFSKYENEVKVIQYIEAYKNDVILHYDLFLKKDDEMPNLLTMLATKSVDDLKRYEVNVFIDNRKQKGAPVVYETNPIYNNLLGKIEYKGALGNWVTDFTQIKPGALHQANGGYLIIQAMELLRNPYAWDVLKRALKTGVIQIESMMENYGTVATTGLKPEPIPFNAKVILIGPTHLYNALAIYEEDFPKLFKVKVEFDVEMDRTKEHYQKMASFVKNYSKEQGLLPFHRRALSRVVDFSSRLVADQNKLSTRFQEITKVLVESSYWAQKENAEYVDKEHIQKALHEQRHRSNRIAEKIREMITDGSIMVDTSGERIGQINGLAVIGGFDYVFGVPSRITAQTYVGPRGIINIERETSLSGEIHSKGLMILSGYLSGTFAQNKPLPLSASITFEQTYNLVDGDSASSTELYVLLSSLSKMPIRQGIAVTGSVNQWGEIQPIGGVNEKIEGYFYVCKEKGLTGEQGVIIPHQNIRNLMLNDDVVEAVEQGLFHIYAVKNVAEGIEILTGVKAGAEPKEDGMFEKGTIFGLVAERLNRMYKSVIISESNQRKNIDKEAEKGKEQQLPTIEK